MLEIDTATALAGVDKALKGAGPKFSVENGHDAAVAVITLMHDAQDRLAPETIINADDPALGPKARAAAALWSSAWAEGGGDSMAKKNIREYAEDELDPVYRKEKSFVPSLSLDSMAKSGDFEP